MEETREGKTRQPTTKNDLIAMAIICASVLGAIALLVWAFK